MMLENVFNLKTFTYSETAEKLGLDNSIMTDEQMDNGIRLHELLVHISRQLSIKYTRPVLIQINSGFRSVELNKKIGGVLTSQHCKFQAADTIAIRIPIEEYFQLLKKLAKDKTLTFGQVILEYGKHPDTETDEWIHISTPTEKFVNDFMRSPITQKDGAKIEGKREYIKELI